MNDSVLRPSEDEVSGQGRRGFLLRTHQEPATDRRPTDQRSIDRYLLQRSRFRTPEVQAFQRILVFSPTERQDDQVRSRAASPRVAVSGRDGKPGLLEEEGLLYYAWRASGPAEAREIAAARRILPESLIRQQRRAGAGEPRVPRRADARLPRRPLRA